jgi:5-methylcytosine-specific restriction endonuclease McrA
LQALRRDDWQCAQCGSRHRLEVDHIEATRHRPDLAFSLPNLQTLCASCHTKKTRADLGLPAADPEKQKWQSLLRNG